MKNSKTQQFAKFFLKDIKNYITYEENDKKIILEKWITEPSEIIQRPWSGKGYPAEDNFISLNGMLNNINNKKYKFTSYFCDAI